MVDQHELVAPALDAGVHAGGLPVGDHQIVLQVAADGERRRSFGKLYLTIAVLEREAGGTKLDVRRQRGQLILGLLPDQLEEIDVLLLALYRVRLLAARASAQCRRKLFDRLCRRENLSTLGQVR